MTDKNLRQILVEIQSELSVPKNQVNSFGHYNYRSCEDILEALKPILKKHECIVKIDDEIVLIGDRYYVKATAYLMNKDMEMSTTAYAREELDKKGMDGSQITGASSSYARKYALNGLFGIDDAKDSDTTNIEAKTTSPKPPQRTETSKTANVSTEICATCGEPTTYKEGVNKNGKKWGGYFCNNKDHPPKWVSVKQDLPDKVVEEEVIQDLPF